MGYFKNEKQSKITRDKCRRQQGHHVLPLLWPQKPQCTQHRWNSSDKNMLTTESWALPTISPSHVTVSGNAQTHGGYVFVLPQRSQFVLTLLQPPACLCHLPRSSSSNHTPYRPTTPPPGIETPSEYL